jgi:hypothetical protein
MSIDNHPPEMPGLSEWSQETFINAIMREKQHQPSLPRNEMPSVINLDNASLGIKLGEYLDDTLRVSLANVDKPETSYVIDSEQQDGKSALKVHPIVEGVSNHVRISTNENSIIMMHSHVEEDENASPPDLIPLIVDVTDGVVASFIATESIDILLMRTSDTISIPHDKAIELASQEIKNIRMNAALMRPTTTDEYYRTRNSAHINSLRELCDRFNLVMYTSPRASHRFVKVSA